MELKIVFHKLGRVFELNIQRSAWELKTIQEHVSFLKY